MSGYQFACSFRAVPSFFSQGLDRDFLNILQSQGFEPNDTGRRIIHFAQRKRSPTIPKPSDCASPPLEAWEC